jgi:hypothetical protein
MQLVVTSHGFFCDSTHLSIPSNDPFHVLAHATNKQDMVYDAKIISWKAFEMVRVKHRPYLLFIDKFGSSRICLQIVLSMS